MGARGPAPKPTRLKILQGNAGRRPLNKNEPTPREATPTMPAWLKGEAKSEWKRIVPELRAMRLLTIVDRACLAAYCQAWAELVECTKILAEEGRIVEESIFSEGCKVGTRKKKHPIVSLQRDAFARVKAYLGEFGLSPASRSKVKAAGGAKEEADPLEELMQRA